ncbi:Uncharacterised protein [Mycobacteroides abscessus subsp. abscessus]|nr:Uncharacterised protein [Mycobacteroides abscessus subsp. abscessus]
MPAASSSSLCGCSLRHLSLSSSSSNGVSWIVSNSDAAPVSPATHSRTRHSAAT